MKKRKLRLTKETLLRLSDNTLAGIKGGEESDTFKKSDCICYTDSCPRDSYDFLTCTSVR